MSTGSASKSLRILREGVKRKFGKPRIIERKY